jgi:APA family basic amino acid/polyamine antiporter
MRDAATPGLRRELGLTDAVVLGLAAMVGAGVFAAFGPAARAAGGWLLLGLLIAAVIAYCNAVASAQLAAAYPFAGGSYAYGRQVLGPTWGFAAGWAFVIGKTASCAAMALTFAEYVLPQPWQAKRLLALAAVLALVTVNYRGVRRTAMLSRLLVAATLLALTIWAIAVLAGGGLDPARLTDLGTPSAYGVLQSAGLLFFAFAGYARLATMGEEVRDPARIIPLAIPVALFLAVGVYTAVALLALLASGPAVLAGSAAPLATAGAAPVVRAGAAVASLGALLALIAGIGRTGLAMARGGDLPRRLAAVHPRFGVPHHAELAIGAVVGVLVLSTDLRGVLAFSSFGVLVYYAVANTAALRQPAAERRWPRALNVLGLLGCLVLAGTLPPFAVLTGAAVLITGLAGRTVIRLIRQKRP